MENFDLRKYLAENKLLKEEEKLSQEEWDRHYNEWKNNEEFNTLVRHFLVSDGEEENTKYAWDYSVDEIAKEFQISSDVAKLVNKLFDLQKQEDSPENNQSQDNIMVQLYKSTTPENLINTNQQAWENMAWADDYEEYVEYFD
tara:strand:- start:11 stop:439 length:429 start_codon:yes stop_codon:yes gene_type:complete